MQAADSPTNAETQQGGTSGNADEDRDSGTSTSRDADRGTSPASPSPSQSTASAAPSDQGPAEEVGGHAQRGTEDDSDAHSDEVEGEGDRQQSSAPITVSAQAAAEAEVLQLVNEERAKVGCSAVSANSALRDLAEAFSEDMAARDFFDHTDPDGLSPWDRADKAGITSLGGENIARGQADAAAVMEAWMNSPGHQREHPELRLQDAGRGCPLRLGRPLVDAGLRLLTSAIARARPDIALTSG